MCLAKGPQLSDAGEGGNRGFSVSSQALYHWINALPTTAVSGSLWQLILKKAAPGVQVLDLNVCI